METLADTSANERDDGDSSESPSSSSDEESTTSSDPGIAPEHVPLKKRHKQQEEQGLPSLPLQPPHPQADEKPAAADFMPKEEPYRIQKRPPDLTRQVSASSTQSEGPLRHLLGAASAAAPVEHPDAPLDGHISMPMHAPEGAVTKEASPGSDKSSEPRPRKRATGQPSVPTRASLPRKKAKVETDEATAAAAAAAAVTPKPPTARGKQRKSSASSAAAAAAGGAGGEAVAGEGEEGDAANGDAGKKPAPKRQRKPKQPKGADDGGFTIPAKDGAPPSRKKAGGAPLPPKRQPKPKDFKDTDSVGGASVVSTPSRAGRGGGVPRGGKKRVSKEEEKEIKKSLKAEIRRRQTDAQKKVNAYYHRELKMGTQSRINSSGDALLRLSKDLPPDPTESVLSDFPPDQASRLIASWSFLQAFSRPLDMLSVPTLPELCDALKVLSSTSADGGESAAAASSKARADAEKLWNDVCISLTRAIAPELEGIIALRNPTTQMQFEEAYNKSTGLFLPLNSLTWREIARLSLLMWIYACFGILDNHIAELLHGRYNFKRNRVILKMLKKRLEARMRAKLAIRSPELKPLEAGVDPTAPPPLDGVAGPLSFLGTQDARKAEDPLTFPYPPPPPIMGLSDLAASTTAGGGGGGGSADAIHPTPMEAPPSLSSSAAVPPASTPSQPPPPGVIASGAVKPEDGGVKPEGLGEGGAMVPPPPPVRERSMDSKRSSGGGEEEDDGDEQPRRREDSERGEGDDEDEEEEEEEGADQRQMTNELKALLMIDTKSEDEKRMACILQRLSSTRCASQIGVDSTQCPDVESRSLEDYLMLVWKPMTITILIGKLREGEYAGEGGVSKFVRHVNLMCRNSWACNMEDSEGWSGAEKFLGMFDRLLYAWVLDDNRPPVDQLTDDRCALCAGRVEKADRAGNSCNRCGMVMHSWCIPPGADFDDYWACDDCVTLRIRKQFYPKLDAEPSVDDVPELRDDQTIPPELRELLYTTPMVMGEWGPTVAIPPLLDVTLNKTVMHKVRTESDMYVMVSAAAFLCGRGGRVPEVIQRTLMLEALCFLASNSQQVKTYLETQDHRVTSLRRRLPDDENVLRNELKEIGGDEAVLAWKDPMTEVQPEPEAPQEEEPDEGPQGVCSACKQSTEGEDENLIVLCETCNTEIHLRCLDPNLQEVPDKEWYCAACKSKKYRRRQRSTVAAVELEDLFAQERQQREMRLMNQLVDEKCEEKADEAAGLAPPPKMGGVTCTYCGYGELELCSPLVIGQTPDETEEHFKASPMIESWVREQLNEKSKKKKAASKQGENGGAATDANDAASKPPDAQTPGGGGRKRKRGSDASNAAEDESLPPIVPYFPRIGSLDARRLPHGMDYPVVHERCAVHMTSLRAKGIRERELTGSEGRDDRFVDNALKLAGTRMYPIGEDRHHRLYWKMPGDEVRLFVLVVSLTTPIGPEGPQSDGKGTWLCYEKKEDFEALYRYLDSRNSRERALRSAIEQEYLTEKPKPVAGVPESAVIRRKPEHEDDQAQLQGGEAGGFSASGLNGGMAIDVVPQPQGGDMSLTGNRMDVDPHADHASFRHQQHHHHMAGPTGLEGGHRAVDDDQRTVTDGGESEVDMEKAMAEGNAPVALKFMEEKCQVELPEEVTEIEVDPYLWGEALREQHPIRKQYRRFYALALVDASDRVWELRNISVKYEVFKGGDLLETATAPKAHKDCLFWFNAVDFLLPGIYTLRFTVGEPYTRKIKPVCVRTYVRAKRSETTFRSILSNLSFLHAARGGRASHRHAQELEIPDDADEVSALRMALVQLKESLPYGALVEREEDLRSEKAREGGGGGGGGSSTANKFLFGWTEALEAQWMSHLMEAKTPQEVMEDLILLETCLHPDWLKPWYSPMKRTYAVSATHLLRIGTAAVTAMHLFVLDKAIMYEKEKKVLRKTRTDTRRAAAAEKVVEPPKPTSERERPSRRTTMTSRYAGGDESGQDDHEETESEGEGAGDSDVPSDDSRRGRSRSTRATRASKKKATAAAVVSTRPARHSLRERRKVSYKDEASDDDMEEDDNGSDGMATRKSQRLKEANSGDYVGRLTRGGGDGGGVNGSHSDGEAQFEDPQFVKNCRKIIKKMWDDKCAGPFLEPVRPEAVPGYYDVITQPMSLEDLKKNVTKGKYQGSINAFASDARLIWTNSEAFNGVDHPVTQYSHSLRDIFEDWYVRHAYIR